MRILIAEDDRVSSYMLEATLTMWQYETIVTSDGAEAWAVLESEDAPPLAIMDWMMPVMDGLEVTRRARQIFRIIPTYIILLTAKSDIEDIVEGFEAGADDYITKPFRHGELRSRVQVGARVVELQRSLTERISELEGALSQVNQLQGLLPICSYCRKIRDDQNYWQRIENYITDHSHTQFSHGICPECYVQIVQPELRRLKDARNARQ